MIKNGQIGAVMDEKQEIGANKKRGHVTAFFVDKEG